MQSDLASVLSDVLIYDPAKDSWTKGQNMTTLGRTRPSCGYDPVLQNIHVLGGQNTLGSGIVVNPHVIYSIANDTWHNASNPTADHGRLGRAYYEPNSKSMVFVGGAFTTAQSVYNTETGNWTQWAPVPDVTYFYALVVRPDRVLLLGGAENSTLFTYFIANDTWVNGTINAVGVQDFYANTAQVGGSVYALGLDAKLYVSRCLVADNCDASRCLGSCVAETGFCVPLSDVTCDDDNECTTDDTCQVGVCIGTGLSNVTCTDNDPCTLEDMCLNGVCTAGNKTAIECIPPVSEPMADAPLTPSVNTPLRCSAFQWTQHRSSLAYEPRICPRQVSAAADIYLVYHFVLIFLGLKSATSACFSL